jgi:hypothetical protein
MVIHEKVEENKEKENEERKIKLTYITTSKKMFTLIFHTFTLFAYFILIRQHFTKNSYFNTLLVILVLNIKTMYNIIRS